MMSVDYNSFQHHDVELNDDRIHYVDEGDGFPVLLVHGSPLSSFAFRHQIAALSGRFRVLAPDLPGFGRSSKPDSGASFAEQSTALRLLAEHLQLTTFHLLVHDWGGPVGFAAFRDRLDQIEKAVLLNTTLRPDFTPPWYWRQFTTSGLGDFLLVNLNIFSVGLPTMMKAARKPAIRSHYQKSLQSTGTRRTMLRLEQLEGYHTLMERVADALQNHNPPACIIWGTPDEYFSRRELDHLRTVFAGSSVHEIPGGGHFSMEDAPETLTKLLQDFF